MRRRLSFEGELVARQNERIARKLRDAEVSLAREREQCNRIARERNEADEQLVDALDSVARLSFALLEEQARRQRAEGWLVDLGVGLVPVVPDA